MATAVDRQLKRLGLYGLARLSASPGPAPTEHDLANVRRVLVVRPDERIGNAILIIPLLNAIKSRFQRTHLSLVMSRRYWDLREFIPAVDEFIPFDKRRYARNPLAFFGLLRRLRRRRFDLVFDASGDHSVSFTHLAITAFSAGRFRIGHDRGDAKHSYEVAVPVAPNDHHETERHLDLLRAIAPGQYDPRPLLVAAGDSGRAAHLWKELGWQDDLHTVIIHPGARGRKRWPAPNFAEVADCLSEKNHQVGVVWGPGDRSAAEEMLSLTFPAVRSIGSLPFRDFVSIVRRADVFFSGDCGPMHLAAATPPRRGVVTVFLIDRRSRFGPLGPRDIALVDDPTAPDVNAIVARISDLCARSAFAAGSAVA